MSRRGLTLTIGGGALVMACAAAWAMSITDVPQRTNVSKVQEPPAWPSNERTEVTEAQLIHAYAVGTLDRPIKTLLHVRGRMHHGEYRWNDRKVPQGKVWIRVDLDSQLISVFRAGHEIGTAVILYGADEKQSPSGNFPILWKRKDHHSATYDAPMPYTLRLTEDGVAIHGSDVRWGRATHGCIGVPIEFAKRLFDQVKPGDEVLIVASRTQPSAA